MQSQSSIKTVSWQRNGLAIIRITTGLLIIYHGMEIFQPEIMNMYLGWDVIKSLPFPVFMTYFGKGIELVTGVCMALGLFTRLAALLLTLNMLFICFYVGSGKFYYEDQHPFIFAMLAMVFFFSGSVKFGLDNRLFKDNPVTFSFLRSKR
ncbi:MAG TPA: DoxX family protein [Ignavibacteriaceae bacterium]|nr:DoxX family protein [Ignavibacteriaceae bacterium]